MGSSVTVSFVTHPPPGHALSNALEAFLCPLDKVVRLANIDTADITASDSFPEAAGPAALAASVYRLAVLAPESFATSRYVGAADAWRKAVVKTVSASGQLAPVVHLYTILRTRLMAAPVPRRRTLLYYSALRTGIASARENALRIEHVLLEDR